MRPPGGFAAFVSSTSRQVNLLSMLVLIFTLVGFQTGFLPIADGMDVARVSFAIAGLVSVVVLNMRRRHDYANIFFYVSLNILSILSLRHLHGRPGEAVLTYVLLMSPIVFLFEGAYTRLICMGVILFRMIVFELNVKYTVLANEPATPAIGETSRLAYDGIILGLIVVIFLLYAFRIRAVEKAQQSNAIFGQHMTHDLQVSYHAVNSIIGHLKYSQLDDESSTITDELAHAATFFAYILNNFLEFSRYEHAQLEVKHIEEFDLAAELEKIVGLYKYMADEKEVVIELDLDDRLPGLIFSDKIKIIRIVLNLLTNAIHHTERGKTITVGVRWRGGPWELYVANEGERLEEEQISRLFDSYEKRREAKAGRRLGLGLPITRELVEALGGRITASSDSERRTLFTVAFPV